AFCVALAYLYLMAREHLDDRRATAALWLIAAYPFSVFFGAIYTESLFLLAMLGAFHHLRRHQWLPAAAFGLLLGLTNANAFFFAAPRAIAAVAWHRRRSVWPGFAVAGAPILGAAICSAIVYQITGDPLMWLRAQGAWGRQPIDLVGSILGTAAGARQPFSA